MIEIMEADCIYLLPVNGCLGAGLFGRGGGLSSSSGIELLDLRKEL